MMNLQILIRLILVVVAVSIPAATSLAHGGHDDHVTSSPAKDQKDVFVMPSGQLQAGFQIVPVRRGVLTSFLSALPGTVKAAEPGDFSIYPRLPGVVKDVLVNKGDLVSPGTVLATVESSEAIQFMTEVLENRLKTLAEIESTKTRYGADIANLRQDLILAENNYGRAQQLRSTGVVSQKVLEQAKNIYEIANKKLSSQEELLALDMARLNKQLELIDQISLQRAVNLGMSQGDFGKAIAGNKAIGIVSLVSPVKGVVTVRDLRQGMVVDKTKQAFAVVDLSLVWVDLSIPQDKIDQVAVGQTVTISTEWQQEFSGSVSAIGPTVDTFMPVRIAVDNPDFKLRPGMFVSGRISIKVTSGKTLIVPTSSVIEQEDDHGVVYVQTDKFTFHRKRVITGVSNADSTEIKLGLSENDSVVVKGAWRLAQGGSRFILGAQSDEHDSVAHPGTSLWNFSSAGFVLLLLTGALAVWLFREKGKRT